MPCPESGQPMCFHTPFCGGLRSHPCTKKRGILIFKSLGGVVFMASVLLTDRPVVMQVSDLFRRDEQDSHRREAPREWQQDNTPQVLSPGIDNHTVCSPCTTPRQTSMENRYEGTDDYIMNCIRDVSPLFLPIYEMFPASASLFCLNAQRLRR